MSRRWAALSLAAVLALAACGAGGGDLSQAAAARLGPQVAAIRSAATAGDRAGAEAAVAQLRATIAQMEQAGEIPGERAKDMLAAAAAVEAQLGLLPAPTTTTTTAPPPAPPPEPERGGDGDGDDKDDEEPDKGKKGRGDDD